jgi:ParB/RepB/Spo0J family partition protein
MKIKIDLIKPNPFQPRIFVDEKKMEELAENIKQFGLLQPILVRPIKGKYQIAHGERRWRACKLIGMKEIETEVKELTDKQMLEIALTENLQREDLNPIEEADGYNALIEKFEYTQEQLSKKIGKSRPYIANSLRLLKLPEWLRTDVLYKTFSPWHARALMPIKDDWLRFHIGNFALDWEWSVDELRANVKRVNDGDGWIEWYRWIPIEKIDESASMRTFLESGTLKVLADSIKMHGLLQPISVRWIGHYQLIDGKRRMRACSSLGWKWIYAKIVFYLCDLAKREEGEIVEPSEELIWEGIFSKKNPNVIE